MNEPIRVLQVFAALDAGGVENFVMNMYRAADISKVQFDFAMTSGKKGLYDEEVLARGGRIFYFDTNKSIRKNLSAILAENGPFATVHSHLFFYSGVVLSAAKKFKIPVRIAHAHNAHTGESRSILRRLYEWAMRRLILKNSTHMLGCSEKACRYVFGDAAFESGRAAVLNDGIDCARFAFDPAVRAEMRKSYGLSDKFVVGHVGHFNAAKNHEKILGVFSEICARRSDAALLLVGDGELEGSVRSAAAALGLSGRVVFAGAMTDVERAYQAMDVFLFPSRYEGFGMAMIEAQASGLSCVASDVVPRETDATGRVRFLPLEAPDEEWAQAVLGAKQREHGCSVAASVRAAYDINAAIEKLNGIYFTPCNRRADA